MDIGRKAVEPGEVDIIKDIQAQDGVAGQAALRHLGPWWVGTRGDSIRFPVAGDFGQQPGGADREVLFELDHVAEVAVAAFGVEGADQVDATGECGPVVSGFDERLGQEGRCPYLAVGGRDPLRELCESPGVSFRRKSSRIGRTVHGGFLGYRPASAAGHVGDDLRKPTGETHARPCPSSGHVPVTVFVLAGIREEAGFCRPW